MRSHHDLSRPPGAAAEPRSSSSAHGPAGERFPWGYLGAFLFGTALISTFIWFQIEGERQTALAQWQARITTIAEGRAHLLSDWFKGRRADADVLASSPAVRSLMLDGSREVDVHSQIVTQLDRVASAYDYAGISLMDSHGQILARSTGAADVSRENIEAAVTAAQTGTMHVDLVEKDARRMLVMSVPVFPDGGVDSSRPAMGVVTLLMRPETRLFPVLTEHTAPARDPALPPGREHGILRFAPRGRPGGRDRRGSLPRDAGAHGQARGGGTRHVRRDDRLPGGAHFRGCTLDRAAGLGPRRQGGPQRGPRRLLPGGQARRLRGGLPHAGAGRPSLQPMAPGRAGGPPARADQAGARHLHPQGVRGEDRSLGALGSARAGRGLARALRQSLLPRVLLPPTRRHAGPRARGARARGRPGTAGPRGDANGDGAERSPLRLLSPPSSRDAPRPRDHHKHPHRGAGGRETPLDRGGPLGGGAAARRAQGVGEALSGPRAGPGRHRVGGRRDQPALLLREPACSNRARLPHGAVAGRAGFLQRADPSRGSREGHDRFPGRPGPLRGS